MHIQNLFPSPGCIQFTYYLMVGSFPFNSFLSGFISSMGTFTLTICLRVQVLNPSVFKLSTERAFADYLIAILMLSMACICFVG